MIAARNFLKLTPASLTRCPTLWTSTALIGEEAIHPRPHSCRCFLWQLLVAARMNARGDNNGRGTWRRQKRRCVHRSSLTEPGSSKLGFGGAPDGDISARVSDSILITPSGARYSALRPAMITQMPLGGEYGAWKGPMKPSGEWRVHLDIARARPDIGASSASSRLTPRRSRWRINRSPPHTR